MRLISLNLWGGIVYEPLVHFIESHAEDTDIFCFQEMIFGSESEFTSVHKARINLFDEIKLHLSGFTAYRYLSDADHFQTEPVSFPIGLALFVRNSRNVIQNGSFRSYKKGITNPTLGAKQTGNCGWADIDDKEGALTVLNVHGLWQKDTNKMDTPERIEQSTIIKNFLKERSGRKIICGDFNLKPETESIQLLEEGMKNLIKDYKVTSTRSELYQKEDKFCDYMFVSSDIEVKDFKVLLNEVSDHLPLYLEFE